MSGLHPMENGPKFDKDMRGYAFTGLIVVRYFCWPISLSIILGSKLNHCPRFEAVIQAGHAFAARLVSTDTCQAHLTIGIGRAIKRRCAASLPLLHTGDRIQTE